MVERAFFIFSLIHPVFSLSPSLQSLLYLQNPIVQPLHQLKKEQTYFFASLHISFLLCQLPLFPLDFTLIQEYFLNNHRLDGKPRRNRGFTLFNFDCLDILPTI